MKMPRYHTFARQGMAPGRAAKQTGQALLEALVAMSVLLLIWAAVAWLGRYQDIALQASHASRYAAFAQARGAPAQLEIIRQEFFTGPTHQWADRRGGLLFERDGRQADMALERPHAISHSAQPGQSDSHASTLREQWQLADAGLLDAKVRVRLGPVAWLQPGQGGFMSGIRDFDRGYPALTRHTAILTDVGHASSDQHMQDRIAGASFAWGDAAANSYGHNARISAVMNPVDAGWQRPEPEQEWLNSWAGDIPERHRYSGDP